MLTIHKRTGSKSAFSWLPSRFHALLGGVSLLVLGAAAACSSQDDPTDTTGCGTTATVKDLTGLDGCGYVLELENGKKLEPLLDSAAAEPSIAGVALRNGMRVTIAYRELNDRASICMAGKAVEVTCFRQADSPAGE